MDSVPTGSGLTRRKVLVAGTGTVLGASLLAACGGDDAVGTPTGSGSAGAGSSAGGGGGTGGGGGSGPLAKVADVPVGGAVSATSAEGKPLIVCQPSKGTVVAFSAICTHQGCTVAPQGKILACPCHGSTYDLATGDNTGGPAPRPLTEVPVRVEGGDVVEA